MGKFHYTTIETEEIKMEPRLSNAHKFASGVGAAMMISWILFLGPVGLLFLFGVAYAIVVQNLALGIICGLLLFTPLILMILWAPAGLLALKEASEAKVISATESAVETVSQD